MASAILPSDIMRMNAHSLWMAEVSEAEIKLREFLVSYCERCLEKSECESMSEMATKVFGSHGNLLKYLKNPLTHSMLSTRALLQLYEHTGVPIFCGFAEVAWESKDKNHRQEEHVVNGRTPVRPIHNVSAKAG